MTLVDKLNAAFMLYMATLEQAVTEECMRLNALGLEEDEVKESVRADIDRHHSYVGQFGE